MWKLWNIIELTKEDLRGTCVLRQGQDSEAYQWATAFEAWEEQGGTTPNHQRWRHWSQNVLIPSEHLYKLLSYSPLCYLIGDRRRTGSFAWPRWRVCIGLSHQVCRVVIQTCGSLVQVWSSYRWVHLFGKEIQINFFDYFLMPSRLASSGMFWID